MSTCTHKIPRTGTVSWWLRDMATQHSNPQFNTDPFSSENTYDVVIIGAGMTGVSCAYWLSKLDTSSPPLRVLVVETRQHVSCGATGRNGGHLWPRSKSELGDADYHTFHEHCVSILREKIMEVEEECEWAETGAVSVARFQDEVDDWEDFYDTNEDNVELWDQEELNRRIPQIDSDMACGGVFYKECGQFYPQKFVLALYEEIKEKVQFSFLTHVDIVERHGTKSEGQPEFTLNVSQQVENGFVCTKIHTQKLIHCTNAYVKLLPEEIQEEIIPFRGQVIITKPTDEKFGLIPHSLAFNDGYEYLIHRRMDHRIVYGGMRWVSDTQEEHTIDDSSKHPEISSKLLENLQEWFPEAHLEIETDWTGIMANTLDMRPIVGHLESQNELLGVAFCGNGMPKAFGVGEALAKAAIDSSQLDAIPSCLRPDRLKSKRRSHSNE